MRRSKQAGFTLIEVLIASLIMAVAVSALLGNLSVSTGNLIRTGDMDRLTFFSKRKMDELITMQSFPRGGTFQGVFEMDAEKKPISGWQAVIIPVRISTLNNSEKLDRVELDTWIQVGGKHRTMHLSGYRITGATR